MLPYNYLLLGAIGLGAVTFGTGAGTGVVGTGSGVLMIMKYLYHPLK